MAEEEHKDSALSAQVPDEAVDGSDQSSDASSQSAPPGTPDGEQSKTEGKQAEAEKELANLEKRKADTLDALKEAQRELHEQRGYMKAQTEAEEARRNQVDPAVVQQQREDKAAELGITVEALAHFENLSYQQHQFMETEIEKARREASERFATMSDDYKENAPLIEELSKAPEYAGWTKAQIAQNVAFLRGKLGPVNEDGPKPPNANPAGGSRQVAPKAPKDGFTEQQRQWLNAQKVKDASASNSALI